jgi:hypothetical protein
MKSPRASSIAEGDVQRSQPCVRIKQPVCTDVRRARAIQRWQRIQERVCATGETFAQKERRKAFQERRWFTISNPESYPYHFSAPSTKVNARSLDVHATSAESECLLPRAPSQEEQQQQASPTSTNTSNAALDAGRKMR